MRRLVLTQRVVVKEGKWRGHTGEIRQIKRLEQLEPERQANPYLPLGARARVFGVRVKGGPSVLVWYRGESITGTKEYMRSESSPRRINSRVSEECALLLESISKRLGKNKTKSIELAIKTLAQDLGLL